VDTLSYFVSHLRSKRRVVQQSNRSNRDFWSHSSRLPARSQTPEPARIIICSGNEFPKIVRPLEMILRFFSLHDKWRLKRNSEISIKKYGRRKILIWHNYAGNKRKENILTAGTEGVDPLRAVVFGCVTSTPPTNVVSSHVADFLNERFFYYFWFNLWTSRYWH
jgi:hypothetical protein